MLIEKDGWTLQRATTSDLDILMSWLRDAESVLRWGGPGFKYPFTKRSFRKNCHWREMNSFSLKSPEGEFVAFGQLYDRIGRINLARLIVRPDLRGLGLGRELIEMLMQVGKALFPLDEYSLFVHKDNVPALRCYKSLGFEIRDYPTTHSLTGIAHYLTRPVDRAS